MSGDRDGGGLGGLGVGGGGAGGLGGLLFMIGKSVYAPFLQTDFPKWY